MLRVRITAIRQTIYNDLIAQYEHGNVASLTTPTLIRLINRNKPTASQQKVLTYTHN